MSGGKWLSDEDIAHMIIDMVRDWVEHRSEPLEYLRGIAGEQGAQLDTERILEALLRMDEHTDAPEGP